MGARAESVSDAELAGLQRLVDDRDRIAHQESRNHTPYTYADLEHFAKEVWRKGWLVPFLNGIHSAD